MKGVGRRDERKIVLSGDRVCHSGNYEAFKGRELSHCVILVYANGVVASRPHIGMVPPERGNWARKRFGGVQY